VGGPPRPHKKHECVCATGSGGALIVRRDAEIPTRASRTFLSTPDDARACPCPKWRGENRSGHRHGACAIRLREHIAQRGMATARAAGETTASSRVPRPALRTTPSSRAGRRARRAPAEARPLASDRGRKRSRRRHAAAERARATGGRPSLPRREHVGRPPRHRSPVSRLRQGHHAGYRRARGGRPGRYARPRPRGLLPDLARGVAAFRCV